MHYGIAAPSCILLFHHSVCFLTKEELHTANRQQQQDRSPLHCKAKQALQAMVLFYQLFSIVKTWLHAAAFAKQNCHN